MENNWIENYINAGSPDTSADHLALLALSKNFRIRRRVAENCKTPSEALEKLASDQHPEVRLAAAANPSTPVDITYRLAYDEDATVRFGLAEDPNMPLGVLKILSLDENPYVSCRAKRTMAEKQPQTIQGCILPWRTHRQRLA